MKKQLFLLIFAVYLLLAKGIFGNLETSEEISDRSWTWGLDGAHAVSSYSTLLSLVQTGSVDVNTGLAIISSPDIGYLNGLFYSFFPPGVAISALPLYLLGYPLHLGQMFAYLTPVLFSIMAMFLTFSLAKNIFGLSEEKSVLAVFILSFGSFLFPYSNTLFQHAFTAAIGCGLFYLCYRFKKAPSMKDALLIFGIYAISSFFDYPNLILFSPYIIYILVISSSNKVALRRLLAGTGIFLTIMLVHTSYNFSIFGNATQLSNTLPMFTGSNIESLRRNASIEAERKQNLTTHLNITNMPNGLYSLLLSPSHGMLILSPIFIFSLFGIKKLFKTNPQEVALAIVLVGINILLYANFGSPTGGWSFGSRYLIVSLPILSILAANGLSYASIKNQILFFLALIISIAHSLASALSSVVIPTNKSFSLLQTQHFSYIQENLSSSFFYNTILKNVMILPFFYIILLTIIASFGLEVMYKCKPKGYE